MKNYDNRLDPRLPAKTAEEYKQAFQKIMQQLALAGRFLFKSGVLRRDGLAEILLRAGFLELLNRRIKTVNFETTKKVSAALFCIQKF